MKIELREVVIKPCEPRDLAFERLFVVPVVLVLLNGCAAVGPNYTVPDLKPPAAYRHSAAPGEVVALPRVSEWWTVFGDRGLDELVRSALARNPTVDRAVANLTAVRAQARRARADGNLSLGLASTSQIAGETATQYLPIGGQALSYRISGSNYSLPLDASYEVDLWGRVLREREGAGARLQASDADLHGVVLSLTASVVQTYLQWRVALAQIAVSEHTIEIRRVTVEILGARHRAGVVDALDLASAREQLANAEASLADLNRQREEDEDALAALTGWATTDFASLGAKNSVATGPESAGFGLPAPPVIPVGLPADLLRRRPDLVEAERTLAAQTAAIGETQAAKFPAISVTGSAGFESIDLRTLVSRPALLWQIGPTVSWPIFDGGRNQAEVAVARARRDAALADYRQQARTAFREVEDAQVDLRRQSEQAAAQERAAAAAREITDLARLRYAKGVINYLDVAAAERDLLAAQSNCILIAGARCLSTVALIKAIGGGWN